MLTSIMIELSGTKMGESNEIRQTLSYDAYKSNNAAF